MHRRTPLLRGTLAVVAAVPAILLAAANSGGVTASPARPVAALTDTVPAADDPIIIGHTGGATGFLSFYDMPIRDGIQLAIDEVNAAGGVLGRQLQLVTSDNQSDISRLESSALDVIEQGAEFVVTTCDYDFGGPAARVA